MYKCNVKSFEIEIVLTIKTVDNIKKINSQIKIKVGQAIIVGNQKFKKNQTWFI